MGRRSNATLARLNNLPRPVNLQNTTVEEVSDDEDTDFEDEDFLEHGFFFLDEGPCSLSMENAQKFPPDLAAPQRWS